ncbi:MAG TPA: ATP-binding protein, partial [Anaerolineaceae bacterium]|nr:ATP-binding protein [Anaerolineaceae bacterium]
AYSSTRMRVYLATLRDITAAKLAEQANQAREKRYRSLFEQMPAFCQVIDEDGRLVDVNSSWSVVLGYERDEVIGECFDRFLTPYSKEGFQTILADLRGRGSVHHAVVEVIRKDGSMLVTAFSANSLFDSSGQMQEATCLLVDVTEQRRVADQVRRLNEELEQRVLKRTTQLQAAVHELEAFSYSVSHDLRAPLRAIDGFSRILVEEYAPNFPAEAVHYLDLVRENAQTMGNLIDHLLAFSRLNRAPLKKQIVDPNQLVNQCLTTLTSQIDGRKIDFELNELPACQADPTLLKQVYINLLSNAIKFTGKEAHAVIEVGCRKEGAERVYYVKDNGVGFDMQYAPKLFGVFQRLHRAEDYEGTGVGLAIVQRIVHRHGGRVWATAQVNGGATFSFTLDGNGQHA